MIGRLEHVQGHAETFEGHIAKHKEGTLVEEGKGELEYAYYPKTHTFERLRSTSADSAG